MCITSCFIKVLHREFSFFIFLFVIIFLSPPPSPCRWQGSFGEALTLSPTAAWGIFHMSSAAPRPPGQPSSLLCAHLFTLLLQHSAPQLFFFHCFFLSTALSPLPLFHTPLLLFSLVCVVNGIYEYEFLSEWFLELVYVLCFMLSHLIRIKMHVYVPLTDIWAGGGTLTQWKYSHHFWGRLSLRLS